MMFSLNPFARLPSCAVMDLGPGLTESQTLGPGWQILWRKPCSPHRKTLGCRWHQATAGNTTLLPLVSG